MDEPRRVKCDRGSARCLNCSHREEHDWRPNVCNHVIRQEHCGHCVPVEPSLYIAPPGISFYVIKAMAPWQFFALSAIWRVLDAAARRLGAVVVCETRTGESAEIDIICVRDLGE